MRLNREKRKPNICLVASSGGHCEELKNLDTLKEKYSGFYVTEKTDFHYDAKYLLPSTGSNDLRVVFKMMFLCIQALIIWIKEKPDLVISTGALICIPFWMLARVFGKKVIFIETYARVRNGSKTGKFMYKHSDLFIIQWESLREVYPNAVFGGSIF